MTDETRTETAEESIGERVERVETIVDRLEDGEVSLERAKELRDEGRELLAELEEALEVGDGEVIERSSGSDQ